MIPEIDPRTAVDYRYFQERLAETELLSHAVALPLTSGGAELAVPVGACRRGGYASFARRRDARTALRDLEGVPGFPDLRVHWSPWADTCHSVEWGEEPPEHPHNMARGLFYGYRWEVVAAFCARDPEAHVFAALCAPPRPCGTCGQRGAGI